MAGTGGGWKGSFRKPGPARTAPRQENAKVTDRRASRKVEFPLRKVLKNRSDALSHPVDRCILMNYKHLHYFWATAKAGGIVRARAPRHVTPQTQSTQIKQLE
jgi:hypothetical protein